jgi:hypothetical protein
MMAMRARLPLGSRLLREGYLLSMRCEHAAEMSMPHRVCKHEGPGANAAFPMARNSGGSSVTQRRWQAGTAILAKQRLRELSVSPSPTLVMF